MELLELIENNFLYFRGCDKWPFGKYNTRIIFCAFPGFHSRRDSKAMLSDDLQENREGSLVHGEERLQAVT